MRSTTETNDSKITVNTSAEALAELVGSVQSGIDYFKNYQDADTSFSALVDMQIKHRGKLVARAAKILASISKNLKADELAVSPDNLHDRYKKYLPKLQQSIDNLICKMFNNLQLCEPIKPTNDEALAYRQAFRAVFSGLFVVEKTVLTGIFTPISPQFIEKGQSPNRVPRVRFLGAMTPDQMAARQAKKEYVLLNSAARSIADSPAPGLKL